MEKKIKAIATILGISIIALIAVIVFKYNKLNDNTVPNSPTPAVTDTSTPEPSATVTPVVSESPTPTPDAGTEPGNNLVIRTDYEAFKPNESGDIPIVMFHRFIEAYEPNTEKEYTTTFAEFEALLQTLYDQGYRLISMRDFIDCNISVPAGTMPMVFTFDDGTAGQFNLIRENGVLKVNPKSAVGIMIEFNKKYPDFGLKGIFYVNMDIGDNTFKGEGTLRERFEILEDLGFEIGTHTWGHVDYHKITTAEAVQESIGKNQEKAEEILPGLRFYSFALPFGHRPKNESLWTYLKEGTYNGINYNHESIMAVGAEPSVPSISKKYNSSYVRRIRAQGRVPVDCDLTWWLPKMTPARMFVSDGDPTTIVVPKDKRDKIDESKLNGKTLIEY
ncbi:MAG: polysaccharide deacetylase family protein [Clostridiaceae bacterium]|nr:polysaccharide deacetylase family protein [Clostridiaceae bacterium]